MSSELIRTKKYLSQLSVSGKDFQIFGVIMFYIMSFAVLGKEG